MSDDYYPEPYQAPRRSWWGRLRAWWLRHEPGCQACRTSREATPGGVCTVCGFDWDDHHKQVTTS